MDKKRHKMKSTFNKSTTLLFADD